MLQLSNHTDVQSRVVKKNKNKKNNNKNNNANLGSPGGKGAKHPTTSRRTKLATKTVLSILKAKANINMNVKINYHYVKFRSYARSDCKIRSKRAHQFLSYHLI